jgi:hypothetical protein
MNWQQNEVTGMFHSLVYCNGATRTVTATLTSQVGYVKKRGFTAGHVFNLIKGERLSIFYVL